MIFIWETDVDSSCLGIVQEDCWTFERVVLGVQFAGKVERDGSGVVSTAGRRLGCESEIRRENRRRTRV
jgi:hypothetical protein